MRLPVECEDAVERPLPVSGDEAAAAAAVESERAELALDELAAVDCGRRLSCNCKAADGRAASSVSAAKFRRGTLTLALDRDAAWAKRSAAAAAIAFCRDVRRWSAGAGAANSSDE
jgi:hypothetical protein